MLNGESKFTFFIMFSVEFFPNGMDLYQTVLVGFSVAEK